MDQGFSLVEILMALVVAGMVLASVIHFLPQVTQWIHTQDEDRRNIRELDVLSAIFGRDVRSMMRLDEGRGFVHGTASEVTWRVTTPRGGRTITYRYDVASGRMLRHESPGDLDAADSSSRDVVTSVLASGIKRVQFSYFNRATRSWTAIWEGDRRESLPDAIAIDVEFVTGRRGVQRFVASPRAAGDSLW